MIGSNPIITRELIGMLRTRKALAWQVGVVAMLSLLVVLRWPSDAMVNTSGEQARDVLRVFGYGLMIAVVMLAPQKRAPSDGSGPTCNSCTTLMVPDEFPPFTIMRYFRHSWGVGHFLAQADKVHFQRIETRISTRSPSSSQ